MAKILVIDDDVDLVDLTKTRLEANGYEVIVANDALQATTLAHNESPDLIILDLILPVGGGLSTLQNLKKSTHTKAIPIIVISGTGDQELKDEVNSAGVEGFIEKPYDADDLNVKIKALLPEKEE